MVNQKGKLFVLSAPSGAGKTTLVEELIKRVRVDHSIERVITYTSRTPRSNECSGTDYHFISEDDFRDKIEQQFFIEWSEAYGAYYGSPRHELEKLDQGTSLLMILDLSGAQKVIHDYAPVSIWISPPNLQALQARLLGRSSECADQLNFRLKLAQQELFDESLALFAHRLINDKFHETLNQLEFIVRAEISISSHVHSEQCALVP